MRGMSDTADSTQPPRARWYYNVWFVLFMLFFVLGPFGLPLVWKNPRFPRWVKLTLTVLMACYTVVLVDVTIRMFQTVSDALRSQFNSLP